MWRLGAILGVAVVLGAQEARLLEREIEIVIQEGAASRERLPRLEDARANMPARSCGPRFWLDTITRCRDVATIKRIVVEKYDARFHRTPDDVKRILGRLVRTEVDPPFGAIAWAAGSDWSIRCRLELANGKPSWLATDGWHVRIDDGDHGVWYSRGTVSEAEKLWKAGSSPFKAPKQ